MSAIASGASGDAGIDNGSRPTELLPTTQLVRISAYWLGLTAIDAAVGLFVGFQIAFTNIRGDVGLGAARLAVGLAHRRADARERQTSCFPRGGDLLD